VGYFLPFADIGLPFAF